MNRGSKQKQNGAALMDAGISAKTVYKKRSPIRSPIVTLNLKLGANRESYLLSTLKVIIMRDQKK